MFSTWNPAEKPSEPKKWTDASFRFLFFNHQDYKDCLVNNIKISKEINLFSSRLQRTYIMQESSRPGTTKPHLERMDQHPRDWAFSVEDINKMTEIRRFFRNFLLEFLAQPSAAYHLYHLARWNVESWTTTTAMAPEVTGSHWTRWQKHGKSKIYFVSYV